MNAIQLAVPKVNLFTITSGSDFALSHCNYVGRHNDGNRIRQ